LNPAPAEALMLWQLVATTVLILAWFKPGPRATCLSLFSRVIRDQAMGQGAGLKKQLDFLNDLA
jgi:hypothetical protein